MSSRKQLFMLLSAAMALSGCVSGEYSAQSMEDFMPVMDTTETEEPMETFPSYDWDGADSYWLAAARAGHKGDNRSKQRLMVNIIHYWWANPNTGIILYIKDNFPTDCPTQNDSDLLDLVVQGEWAND